MVPVGYDVLTDINCIAKNDDPRYSCVPHVDPEARNENQKKVGRASYSIKRLARH